MTIAVCIPTYNRPAYLLEALNSCAIQSVLPQEVIVGDDSTNNETEILVTALRHKMPFKLNYLKNSPPLKQAANVNNLFNQVKDDLLILLHDDDTLLPDALETLSNCFENDNNIDVAFGKNYIMSDKGAINVASSDNLNQCYYRSEKYSKNRLTSLESGLLQQIPNDCFIVKTVLAKKIGYRKEANDACDFDFGLRLGMQGGKMFFLNRYTSCYRLSGQSISTSKTSNMAIESFRIVENLSVPKSSLHFKSKWLKRTAPVAIEETTNLGNSLEATRIYFSKWHIEKICSPGGIKRLTMIIKSLFRNNGKRTNFFKLKYQSV